MLTRLSVSDPSFYAALNLILKLGDASDRVVNLPSSDFGQLQGEDVELGHSSGIGRFSLERGRTIHVGGCGHFLDP